MNDDSEVCVISGTRRQIRELVDGSLEVRVHIDPRFKQDFHRLFPSIDMPCALAPLVAAFERLPPPEPQKPRAGQLCILAARWCKDPEFRQWLKVSTEEEAAGHIRAVCNVNSRRDLDFNPEAACLFQENFREPYMEILKDK